MKLSIIAHAEDNTRETHPEHALSVRPVTSAQAGIFFAEQRAGMESTYNYSTRLDVKGPVSDCDLRDACTRLVAATPALRLRIGIDEATGVIVSRFDAEAPEVIEMGWLNDPDQTSAAVEAASARPLAVEDGPLCRFHTFRLSEKSAAIIITVHHLITDGLSHARLIQRLAECVNGPVEPDSALDYVDLVERLRSCEELARGSSQHYWYSRLLSKLPEVRCLPISSGSTGGKLVLEFSDVEAQWLRTVASLAKVSTFKVLVAAVHAALPIHEGITVLCAAASQRSTVGIDSAVIGDFINEVVLTARHEGPDNSKLSILAREAKSWSEDLSHRNYPFIDLANQVAASCDSLLRLDSVMIGYRRAIRSLTWNEGAVNCSADLRFTYPRAKTDLSVRFFDYPDGLECEVQWSDSLSQQSAEDFIDALHDEIVAK